MPRAVRGWGRPTLKDGYETVELCGLVEGFTRRVAKERAYVGGLMDAEVLHSRTVVSLALLAR